MLSVSGDRWYNRNQWCSRSRGSTWSSTLMAGRNNQIPKKRVNCFSPFGLLKESLYLLRMNYWSSSSFSFFPLKRNHFSIILDVFFIKDHGVWSFRNFLCNQVLYFCINFRGVLSFSFLSLEPGAGGWCSLIRSKSYITSPFPVKDFLELLLSHIWV